MARDQPKCGLRPDAQRVATGSVESVSAVTHVNFWGVRGSTPCDGHQFDRYGGNTSCVEFASEGHDPTATRSPPTDVPTATAPPCC